jgi:hypothetical protein
VALVAAARCLAPRNESQTRRPVSASPSLTRSHLVDWIEQINLKLMVAFVVRWEMVAVMVIAMVIGASAIWLRALTANGPGGVAQLSGGIASGKHSAKRANGATSFLKVSEKHYERAYHLGHDPPTRDCHLRRMADAQVERMEAAAGWHSCSGMYTKAARKEDVSRLLGKIKQPLFSSVRADLERSLQTVFHQRHVTGDPQCLPSNG